MTGLLGQHPRITDRKLTLRLDEFLARLGEFRQLRVPAYRAYRGAAERTCWSASAASCGWRS